MEAGGSFTDENMWIISPEGSVLDQPTTRTNSADPAYSPSGTRIIFELVEDPPNQLWIMKPNGTDQKRITPRWFDVQDADWAVKPT